MLCAVCVHLDPHLKGGKRLFRSFSNTMTSPAFSTATSLCVVSRADPFLRDMREDRREEKREGKKRKRKKKRKGKREWRAEEREKRRKERREGRRGKESNESTE